MNWQIVSIIVVGITNVLTLASAYYGLKADNARLSAALELGLLTERTQRASDQTTIRNEFLAKVVTIEQNIKDLGHRVSTLETGQDEWTKTLRHRTHELGNHVNDLVLKVDRLERPSQGAAS